MKRNQYLTIGGIVLFLELVINFDRIGSNGINSYVGYSIGASAGILFFAFILAFLIKQIFKLFKADFTDNSFKKAFIGLVVFFLVIGILSIFNKKQPDNLELTGFKYSPENCKYEVTFSQKPKIETSSITLNGMLIDGELANSQSTNGQSFQRAGFYIVDRDLLKSYNKDSMIYLLKEYSKMNGLNTPEFVYNESPLGKNLTLRAFKNIEMERGVNVPVTYLVSMYLLENNLLTLYVGSKSDIFPDLETNQFLESIKLK